MVLDRVVMTRKLGTGIMSLLGTKAELLGRHFWVGRWKQEDED